MGFSLLERAKEFLRAQRKKNIWYRTMCGLAAVVVFVTTYMLILPAITMERNTICGQEEHTHTDTCYEVVTIAPEKVLSCTEEALGIHEHKDECYDSDHNLICGYADFVVHTHDENCYGEDGKLVCTLPEIKEHEHTASCYKEEQKLSCGQEVSEGHQHSEGCYTKEQGGLTCGTEEHIHIDSCKDADGNYICGKEEHTHNDNCYQWNPVLVCTQAESTGHTHTDACYETVKTLTCDEQEVILHTHTDACYDENGKLKCGMLEVKEHQHTDKCFVAEGGATTEKKLVCEKEEHEHTDACYPVSDEDAANVPMLLADGDGDGNGNDGEGTVENTTTDTLPVTSISGTKVVYDKDNDTYKANVRIEFEFDADTTITSGTPYTYTYPAGIVIPEAELNKTQILIDNSKRTAGIYKFIKNEDGSYSVQIVFNNDYVKNYCNKGEAVTGYVQFEGEFSKSSVQDDGSIVIGGGDLQITIPASEIIYPDEETDKYNISAAKQGEWKKADGKLQYTVYIRTTKGTPDTIQFEDTITIPEGLGLGTPTVTVEKGTTNYYGGYYSDSNTLETVTGVTPSYDATSGKLSMTLDGLTASKVNDHTQAGFYKITYTYPITSEGWTGVIQPENTVVVSSTDTDKNQTVKSEATTKLYLSKETSHTLDKYGQESGNCVKWTITVNRNQVDIAGAKLTDEMLKIAEKMTVTPADGYEYDATTGTITFNADNNGKNENQYTIVYYTPVDSNFNGTTVSNSATFDPTPDQPDDEITVDREVTVSGVGLNKWGSYDQTTGKINWTIEVNSNNRNIANAVLSDAAFGGLGESDITISPTSDYKYVKDGDTITGIRFLAVGTTGENTQKYTITYSTVPETVNPGEETKVSNTANLSPGDGGEGIGKTGEASVPALTVTKGGYYTDSKINWTVTVNAGHRDIAGYELTDSMFKGLKADEITLRYNSWSWYDDVPEAEYTIVRDSEGYVKKIVFNGANGTTVNTNQYFLSYTTAAEPEWNDRVVSNDVHLKKGDIDIPASSTANVPGIKEVEKAGKLNESTDGKKTSTVTWTVTIDVPPSGLPAGVVITDDVTKNSSGSTNNLQWMTWEQIIANNFTIFWKDNTGSTISTSNPYDSSGIPGFSLKFLASDGNEYDYTEIKKNNNDTFRAMTYTILTMTFTDGLTLPESIEGVPTQISFSYDTTVDLEHSEIGTNHFYNCVDVDGEKADAYVDYEKQGVVKTDGNGNQEDSQTSSDGEVTWKVKVKTVGNDLTKLTVTDTLPNGILPKTILVQGSGMSNVLLTVDANNNITGDGSPYHYAGTFDPNTGKLTLVVTNQTVGSVLLENQEWNFTITCEADDTVLPSGNTYTLINNVTVTTDKGSVGSDSQTQEWTHTQSTEETKVVQKTGEWDNNNRLLNYSIVLNPEGKDLVAGVDTLTLIDTLRYQSANIGGTWYEGTDGAKFTIKADLVQNSVRLFKAKWENGKWVKDTDQEITDFSWVYAMEKADDWTQTVTSTLTVSGIPDGCPLIFEYVYAVSSSAENHPNEEKIKFNLPFSNEAKLEGTDHSDSSSSSTEEWKHSSSSAGVETGHHTFTFYKVVKDNYNKALPGAVFSVYEYSKTEGKWLPEAIHTYTTDSEGKFVITFEDTNAAGVGIYKYNTLYAISETIAPDGYIKPEGYNPRYFYFSSDTADNNMPDTHQSGTVDLSSETATSYVENIPNKTEITVEKKWLDENGNDETASHVGEIQLELYQRTGTNSSSQGNLTLTIDVKAGDNGNLSWWSGSEGNIAEGSTVTFSVTNIWGTTSSGYNHITIEGAECTLSTKTEGYVVTETYTFVMNQNVTVGGSINWNTNEISHSSVTVTPPVNTSSGNGDSDENNDTKVADVFLSDENNWTVTITDLPLENTALDGTTENYYYYFKEVNVPEGYTVSYSNGQSCVQSGTITVTNQKNKDVVSATVNKVWKGVNGEAIDGNSETLPASVWVYLTRTVGETTERVDLDGNTGEDAQPYTVTKENNWTLTVDNLPKTDDEGNVYTYSFEEVSVEGYETKVSGNGTVTITNKKTPSDTDLTVKKIWKDKEGNPVLHNDGVVTINLYRKVIQGGSSGGGSGGSETGNEVSISGEIKLGEKGGTWKTIQDTKPVGTRVEIGIADLYYNFKPRPEPILIVNGSPLEVAYATDETWTIYGTECTKHTFYYSFMLDKDALISGYTGNNILGDWELIGPTYIENSDPVYSDEEISNAEGTFYQTVTLNKDNGWSHTFTDLPLTGTGENGETITYYYYVEEVSVLNYTPSYENNGGIQSGIITVTNQAVENPTFELPETGGPGTRIAYTLGSILMLLASAAFLYIKKRNDGKKGGLA